MDKKEPLVSIILPVWNGSRYLDSSILSIRRQSYSNIEIIVIDDCSTDDSPEIILKHCHDDKRIVSYRNTENKKLPFSLNRGILASSGEYLLWTSDDNEFDHNHIELLVRGIMNTNSEMVYSDFRIINENNKFMNISQTENPENLIKGNCIGASFLYKKTIHEKIGFYSEDSYLFEDFEMWIRMFENRVKMHRISSVSYSYRIHGESLSATRKLPFEYYELRRRILKDWDVGDKKLASMAYVLFAQLAMTFEQRNKAIRSLLKAAVYRPFYTPLEIGRGLVRRIIRKAMSQ